MHKKKLKINIPNTLSTLRLFLAPLFIIYMLKGLFTFALIVFIVAGISDGLDGFIARYFNQKTGLGAYLDPIADKILLDSAYICLAILTFIPGWLTVIVISRDVVICVGIMVSFLTNTKIKIKPTIVSKFTTAIQLITVVVMLIATIKYPISLDIKLYLFWITAAFTIASGVHYVYIGLNSLQNSGSNIN